MNAEEDLDVGNDHRTVAATIEVKRKQTKSNKLKQKTKCEPTSKHGNQWTMTIMQRFFTKMLLQNAASRAGKISNSDKVDALEKILIQTAIQHAKPKKARRTKKHSL